VRNERVKKGKRKERVERHKEQSHKMAESEKRGKHRMMNKGTKICGKRKRVRECEVR